MTLNFKNQKSIALLFIYFYSTYFINFIEIIDKVNYYKVSTN